MRFVVDLSYYEDTQLTDEEIIEREQERQAGAKADALREQERQRRMRNFHFSGGML